MIMIGWPNGLKKVYQVRRSFAGPDKPRRITANIAKLPELVRRHDPPMLIRRFAMSAI
jgi:hypothetical protein